MGWLEEYFDRVVVINLDRRPDRYARFRARLAASDWPFRQPLRVPAVDGAATGVPAWWRATPGGWGMLMSLTRVLEDAMREGVERLLVLEDDAVFIDGFRAGAERFLRHVPAEWDQLYLGGLHAREPRRLNEHVYACVNVVCTHGLAASRAFLPRLYRHLLDAPAYLRHAGEWPFDLHLGELHQTGTVRAYAPPAWLVGQDAGLSDIGEHRQRIHFWNSWTAVPEQTLYVLLGLYEGGLDELAALLQPLGAHFGADERGDPALEDGYLRQICQQVYPFPSLERATPVEQTAPVLRAWCWVLLREAVESDRLGAVCAPTVCAMHAELAAAWPRLKAIDVRCDFDAAVARLKARLAVQGVPPIAEERLIALQRFLDAGRRQWLAHHEHLTVDLERLRADPVAVTAELRAFLGLRYLA